MKKIYPLTGWWRKASSHKWTHHQLSSAATEQRKQPEPKPFSEIPELKGLPVIGNVRTVIKAMGSLKGGQEHLFHKLHMELGPIYKLKMMGNNWNVHLASPEGANLVMRSEGALPSRGPFEDNMMWLFNKLETPPPLFFSKGEIWKKTRSNAAKQVVPRRVANFVEPLSEAAELLVTHLNCVKDDAGNIEDIRSDLYKWAFQGVSRFVYNENIDIYSESDPDQQEFLEAGLEYIESIATVASALPLYMLYKDKTYRNYEKILRRMQKAGGRILDRRYKEIKSSVLSGTVDETKTLGLLDQWLIEGKFTEEEALSQSFDMLSAGIDTTSNSACFLLYEIAKQPALQERLVQEITSAIGDKTHPSWEDLQKMTLLRNCVKEVMRLHCPVLAILRALPDDTVLMGYQVPAGACVFLSMSTMSRDSQLFDEPDEFKPDRWNKDKVGQIHPFSSLPFGFGPRACYGRRLAELELYILVAKMLPKYSLTTNSKEMKHQYTVILKPDIPVHLNIQQRC